MFQFCLIKICSKDSIDQKSGLSISHGNDQADRHRVRQKSSARNDDPRAHVSQPSMMVPIRPSKTLAIRHDSFETGESNMFHSDVNLMQLVRRVADEAHFRAQLMRI